MKNGPIRILSTGVLLVGIRFFGILITAAVPTSGLHADEVSGIRFPAGSSLFTDDFSFMGEWVPSSGTWTIRDGKLVQSDAREKIAHISRIVKQRSVVSFSFDLSYLSGLEDLYGGFGLHLSVDRPTGLRSWGQNRSVLLWISCDGAAYGTDDFYLQVYRSFSPSRMEFAGMTGGEYPLPADFLSPRALKAASADGASLRISCTIDGETGEGRLYSSLKPGWFVPFRIDPLPQDGRYISLRTNSLSVAVDNFSMSGGR